MCNNCTKIIVDTPPQIIIVFLILTRLTKCLSDRVLLMFGAATILSSNVWLLYFLPIIPKREYRYFFYTPTLQMFCKVCLTS